MTTPHLAMKVHIFASPTGGIDFKKNRVMLSKRCLRVFGPLASSIACVRFGYGNTCNAFSAFC